MTKRKPPGTSFETWVDKQIREAQERGNFADLPGAGQPLPAKPRTEQTWLKDYLQREGISSDDLLPEPLRLRKEIQRLPQRVQSLRTEDDVRETVEALNARILAWLRFPTGPRVALAPVSADEVIQRWRDQRPPEPPQNEASQTPQRPTRRRRWWHRRR